LIYYVIKRLLATIPVMGVVALFVFSLLYLSPGDPAAVIAGDIATEEDIARIRASLGLDQPYLVRFGHWLYALSQGDLGTSIFTGLPVTHLIAQRVEPTIAKGMPAFSVYDYRKNRFSWDDLKGSVTLLAFWFPT